jgi:hypothetical protein
LGLGTCPTEQQEIFSFHFNQFGRPMRAGWGAGTCPTKQQQIINDSFSFVESFFFLFRSFLCFCAIEVLKNEEERKEAK